MATFFSHGRGAVTRVQGPHGGDVPFKIWIPGGPLTSGIIQQAKIEHQGNYQFLHAISNTIYVYVFGDKIGNLMIAGTAFGVPCRGRGGLTEIMQRYSTYRIAITGRPATLAVENTTFTGFLTGFSLDAADAQTHLANWALRFSFFPTR